MTKQATKIQKKEILRSIRSEKRLSSSFKIADACKAHNITKSTFYNWCRQEATGCLEPNSRKPHSYGNQIDPRIKELILEIHSEDPMMSIHGIHLFLRSNNVKVSRNTVMNVIRSQLL